jgi:hypothetical protein
MKPDGVFLSNGPGDPASMDREVEQIRELSKRQCRRSEFVLDTSCSDALLAGKRSNSSSDIAAAISR